LSPKFRHRNSVIELASTLTEPRRLVVARAGKSHWLVTIFEAYEGRLTIKATGEPPGMVSRDQVEGIPDGRPLAGRRASIGQRDGAARVSHR